MKKFFISIGVIFVALILIGIIFGEDTSQKNNASSVQSTNATPTDDVQNNEITSSSGSSLTGPQSNAIRSAKQYLSFSGFSREGLIQQLSSSYGDGYEVTDATAAVDSLNVDWNEQASRSAKQYLDMSGFSCDGLVEQLSSTAGDKYTVDQAKFGAQQAGACS